MTNLRTTCPCGTSAAHHAETLAAAAATATGAGWHVGAQSAGRIAGDRWDASATGRCPDCVSGGCEVAA